MYAPAFLDRQWREEYEQRGAASVASPNNGWAVAVYLMQTVLGLGHVVGVTAPASFAVVFGETLLMPWALLYLVAGFVGAYAVTFLRYTNGSRMEWSRPEFIAALGLAIANGMYVAALLWGTDSLPHITLIAIGALFLGSLFRSSQIAFEQMKSRRFAVYARE